MDSNNRPPSKVLVITASVGAGHNSAAGAIRTELRRTAPQTQVDMLDVMDLVPWFFRLYYRGGFVFCMTRAPWLWGLLFRLSNRPKSQKRTRGERLRLWFERRMLWRLRRYLREHRYDLIVHTHFLAPPCVGWMLEHGQFDTPHAVVTTDIIPHRFWYASNVTRWFVASGEAVDILDRWGIPADRVAWSGIPIHPKWVHPPDREHCLETWSLPKDRQILLLSGGSHFTVGPIVKIAQSIARTCEQSYTVVLTGRDKALLETLERTPESPERLRGVGWTDRAHEITAAACLMVTKPGGITTAECLSQGTPMVLTDPVPGQEGDNARWLADHGAAVIAASATEVVPTVRRLLGDSARLNRLSQQARLLYRPATQTIGSWIRDFLNRNKPKA